MLSNHEFVWAGYDIGARVVPNDLLFTEICLAKGRRHDDKNHNFFEHLGKFTKINENE